MPAVVSVAVIVEAPTFLVLVIVAVYVPGLVWLAGIDPGWPGSVEENETACPDTGWPSASVTAAAATVLDWPSATIADGVRVTVIAAAFPVVWVRTALPEMPAVVSVAVIVEAPTVLVLVIVAVYVPGLVWLAGIDPGWPGSVEENETACPDTGWPSASVTAAAATVLDWPSATIADGVRVTVIA